MGETLGISQNVFEKLEREKDRKKGNIIRSPGLAVGGCHNDDVEHL